MIEGMDLLLLSNSRTAAGFLIDYAPEIKDFAGTARRALFVPYASVQRTWTEFAGMVAQALPGFTFEILEKPAQLDGAALVMVGGGNTFQLLKECRQRGLLAPMRQAVSGGMKYIGWSAGSNLACPTIKTTNDMPIVDPGGLEALGLLPFQLNCHYVNHAIPGHHGETRDQRLAEFAQVNPGLPVLALPEGDWLRVSDAEVTLRGPHEAFWFQGTDKLPVASNATVCLTPSLQRASPQDR
jgi:dipeptidase E